MQEGKILFYIKDPSKWDEVVEKGLKLIKAGQKVAILASDEAVTRCIRCDRLLFDRLKQFVLDEGDVFISRESLKQFNIPDKRPPDYLIRVESASTFIPEMKEKGWTLQEF